MERAAAAALFALMLPLLAVAAVCLRLLSGRAPLVAHLRVGMDGQPLWIWKLRTMWSPGPREPFRLTERLTSSTTGPPKLPEDPRVTSRFAVFCRRYSIDELPQLWQVALGELALVGPRPITRIEMDRYYAGAADELLRIRPGVAGLVQIMGRSRLSYAQRRRLDLFLVRRMSPGLYARILVELLPRVLRGEGAW